MRQSELETIMSDQKLDFDSAPSGVRRQMSFDEPFKSPAARVIQGIRRCGKSTPSVSNRVRQILKRGTKQGFSGSDRFTG